VTGNDENGRGPGSEELARAFAQLREEDRRAAPSFRALVERGARAGTRRRRSVWASRAAVAAGVLVALALGLLVARSARGPAAESVAAELAGWRSPTAFLLETPGRELASGLPRLGEPAFPGLEAPAGRPKAGRAGPLKLREETRP